MFRRQIIAIRYDITSNIISHAVLINYLSAPLFVFVSYIYIYIYIVRCLCLYNALFLLLATVS